MSTVQKFAPDTENLRRFTIGDFQRMVDAGLFRADERLEWVDGVIYDEDARPAEPRRFSTEEYYRLVELGVLRYRERVELLDGEIFVMSPMDRVHSACVAYFVDALCEGVGRRAIVWPQLPLRLNDGSEPEPDLCLLRRRTDYYKSGHPTPDDVFLVIEVMNTSAYYDRKRKLPAYAASGIPEVWLADLNGEFVEAHRGLRDGAYADVQILVRGQSISPEAFPDVVLPIDDILG